MLNEPVKVQDLKEFGKRDGSLYMRPYSELARSYYAEQLAPKIYNAKQSLNPEVRELAEVVEFLVDCYEKGR
jgi:hypothetical protein